MSRSPSPAEAVYALRHIPIMECGEEMVDFLAHCPALLLDRPRFAYERVVALRRSVAERLCAASELLPKGLRLAIIEGWRPPHIQRRMHLTVRAWLQEKNPHWTAQMLARKANQFTAPLSRAVPPPHSTGGAVDVLLAHEDGTLLDHSSPYGPFDTAGFSLDAPGLSPEARRTRDTLASVLLQSGLTNYPSEYWHWSYGDQGWAYRGGHAAAVYGATRPPGWIPPPEEDSGEPLAMIEPYSARDA